MLVVIIIMVLEVMSCEFDVVFRVLGFDGEGTVLDMVKEFIDV